MVAPSERPALPPRGSFAFSVIGRGHLTERRSSPRRFHLTNWRGTRHASYPDHPVGGHPARRPWRNLRPILREVTEQRSE